jgi:hypothetical protein
VGLLRNTIYARCEPSYRSSSRPPGWLVGDSPAEGREIRGSLDRSLQEGLIAEALSSSCCWLR